MKVLAIDPGSEVSGVVICEDEKILVAVGKMPNHEIPTLFSRVDAVVMELFVLHGSGGKSCADTLLWTGRLWQAWWQHSGKDPIFLTRQKVTNALKIPSKAKDPRAMDTKTSELMRIIYGTKAKEAKVTHHAWQALTLYTAWKRLNDSGNKSKATAKRLGPGLRETRFIWTVYVAGNKKGDLARAFLRRLYKLVTQAHIPGRSTK